MKIDLSIITKSINKELTQEADISLTSFRSRLGDFPIVRKAPVTLQIRNEENAAVFVKGTVDIDVMIPCARCLEEVRTPIRFDIDKKLTVREEGLVDEEMEEPDYLIGFELDVDKLVYAEILVNWPMRVLCKDDCKGICKVCGMNLNKGACSCQRTELDPRMAAIQDISSKGRRDKRRANWKMSAPTLVKCSKCGELMMPHRVCKNCGSYNKKEIIAQD